MVEHLLCMAATLDLIHSTGWARGSDNSVGPTGGSPSEIHFCYGNLLCLGFVLGGIFLRFISFNLFIFEVLKLIYVEFSTIFFVIVCDNFQFSVSVPLFLQPFFIFVSLYVLLFI